MWVGGENCDGGWGENMRRVSEYHEESVSIMIPIKKKNKSPQKL